MALGTYIGGWRIMRTMGTRIFKLRPPQGFASQVTASAVLYTVATKYGFPVSTTHVISGSVMGAGATTRISAVRWGVAADMVMAWMLTIPAAGARGRRRLRGAERRLLAVGLRPADLQKVGEANTALRGWWRLPRSD